MEKIDGLEGLINQAEKLENDQSEQVKQDQPGYQSAEQIHEKTKERALWMIGAFQAMTSQVAPEAAQLVLTDPALDEGVDKLTAVLEKYPGAEAPEWVKRLLQYKEEFQCGMWFAGTFYGMYQVNKQIKEAAADDETGPAADEAGADIGAEKVSQGDKVTVKPGPDHKPAKKGAE